MYESDWTGEEVFAEVLTPEEKKAAEQEAAAEAYTAMCEAADLDAEERAQAAAPEAEVEGVLDDYTGPFQDA